MQEITIGSIAVAPLIVALIEVAKGFGFPTKYAPWLNAVLTVAAYAAMLYLQANPQFEQPAIVALNMLATFLSAAGLYDIGKQLVRKPSAVSGQQSARR